jgi:hypothetical protein
MEEDPPPLCSLWRVASASDLRVQSQHYRTQPSTQIIRPAREKMSNLIEALEIRIAALTLSLASSVPDRSELQLLSKGWCIKLMLCPNIGCGSGTDTS